MFGWEFPPRISGGLGTACYGLTSALVAQGTEVLFVVPKIHGGEPNNGCRLKCASSVERRQADVYEKIETDERKITTTTTEGSLRTTIEIPASLAPYNSADMPQPIHTLQHWSYRLDVVEESRSKTNVSSKLQPGDPYSFQGGYGSQLIEEVFRYANVASEIAATESFDVIHAHDWMTYPAAIAAKKLSGKPMIAHVHATEFDRSGGQGNKTVCMIERDGLREADRVIAVSHWTKNVLIQEYKIDPEKIDVVHNGVVPEPPSAESKITIGSHVVTFLGRITYQKGPEYFVEAAAKVLEAFPDAHFIMAGSGDMLPEIIEKVARMRLSSRFHFTGFLIKKEINQVLASTSVFVMPSVSEPFGITPLEAIQRDVPIIISNQSGVSEVIHHALKVDFWDTESLAESICSVLQYNSLSRELKRNAGSAIRDITWEKAARKLHNIYSALISAA
jgi:glycosyltransferase involved in cell wall biosynthesis